MNGVHLGCGNLDRHGGRGQQARSRGVHGWWMHRPQSTLHVTQRHLSSDITMTSPLGPHCIYFLFQKAINGFPADKLFIWCRQSNFPNVSKLCIVFVQFKLIFIVLQWHSQSFLHVKRSYSVSKAWLLVGMFQLLLKWYSCSRHVSCRRHTHTCH